MIEIQGVDLSNRSAKIAYMSGEYEDNLALDQVVKDGHMYIID